MEDCFATCTLIDIRCNNYIQTQTYNIQEYGIKDFGGTFCPQMFLLLIVYLILFNSMTCFKI